jgi:hypothetical protein
MLWIIPLGAGAKSVVVIAMFAPLQRSMSLEGAEGARVGAAVMKQQTVKNRYSFANTISGKLTVAERLVAAEVERFAVVAFVEITPPVISIGLAPVVLVVL